MDTVDPSRFIFAFLFVVGLIGLLAMALKHFGASGRFGPAMRASADGRLKVVEVRYIDPKRKLVLVRRDNAEHLLLLADGRETVIEAHIPAPPENAAEAPHA